MKKCIVCEKDMIGNDAEVCETCTSFFKWKYKKRFKRRLRFHKLVSEILEADKNKFRRKK
jgi:hypothetical protein